MGSYSLSNTFTIWKKKNEIAKNDSSLFYTGRSLGKPDVGGGEYSETGT